MRFFYLGNMESIETSPVGMNEVDFGINQNEFRSNC
jgi:hypothetical protein